VSSLWSITFVGSRLYHPDDSRAAHQDEIGGHSRDIYGWFSKGVDTADLKHARGLLDELS
jgi:hypothetical protein